MKRKRKGNNRSVVFKRLEGTGDATNAQSCDTKNNTINVNIEIDGKGLAGYEFFVDGKHKDWQDMTREQQIKVLNSLLSGFELFRKFLKEE